MSQDHKKGLEVRFEPDGITVKTKSDTTVFQAAMDVGVGLRSECGGKGLCGKCLIQATDPNILSPPNQNELISLEPRISQENVRLACQARIICSGVIEIIPEAQTRQRKLQMVGKERSFSIDPFYQKIAIDLEGPSLKDQRSDIQRVIASIQEALEVDNLHAAPAILRLSQRVFREANWKLVATIRNRLEIIELLPLPASDAVLGMAVDLGTSKIVLHLIDLTSGRPLGIRAIENPQLPYGEDVISRIQFAKDSPRNQEILRKKVISSINSAIGHLLNPTSHTRNDIYSLMVVGNTSMLHFFIGADVQYLSRAPFVPLFSDSFTIAPESSGIQINPGGTINLFPSVGGFIGGDCVAAVLSTGIYDAEDLCLVVDIGTNTEIVLGNKRQMKAVSCASGPAFEGIHIQNGMKAVEGAIEHLKIDPETFEVAFEVIGNKAPVGLCGSAMIDSIAELMKTGLLEPQGRFSAAIKTPKLMGSGRNRQFIIASAKESGIDAPIAISQNDIRSLQLAKAAILTGCMTLLRLAGIEITSIKHVYLAGAFGNHVNPMNVIIMGLLPEFPPEKLEFVGNAAVMGAKRALLSRSEFKKATEIARRIEHFELAHDKQFHKEYTEALYFPHRDPKNFPNVIKILSDQMKFN